MSGDARRTPGATPDLTALRPLFDELHDETQAARNCMAEDDMPGWQVHATRAAEIHEELAVMFGWRERRTDRG